MSRVAGEKEERQHEHGVHEGEVFTAAARAQRHVHRQQRDDELVDVIVESGEKLCPEEGLKTART